MAYESYILSHARREIKKISDKKIQGKILLACIITLGDNPRPPGVRQLEGQKDLYRIRIGDYRIIYCIADHIQSVVIVTIRSRGKDTYKKIPTESLSAKITELEKIIISRPDSSKA